MAITNNYAVQGMFHADFDWGALVKEQQELGNKAKQRVYKEYPTPGQTLFENRKAFNGLNYWSVGAILYITWGELPNNTKVLWENRAISPEGKHELECYKKGKFFQREIAKRKIRFVNRSGEVEV